MFVKLRELSNYSSTRPSQFPDDDQPVTNLKTDNNPDQTKNAASFIWWQQIAYAVAVFGSWIIIFTRGYPFFRSCPHVSNHHLTFIYFIFGTCVMSWMLARYTSPGIITLKTIARFDNYPYDDLLYMRNITCPTLGIPKLARSKYDKYTKNHVPRFDHFCGWINQSIGEENYRFFLLFLMVHVLMCLYGTILTFTALWGKNNDYSAKFCDKIISALCLDYGLTVVLLLMSFATLVLGAFLVFHIIIMSKGMTTNEYYKWKILHERHHHAVVLYTKKKDVAYQSHKACDDNHVDEEANATSHVRLKNVNKNEHNPIMPYPTILVNSYDLGFFANLYEVLFPRSLRNRMHHKKM